MFSFCRAKQSGKPTKSPIPSLAEALYYELERVVSMHCLYFSMYCKPTAVDSIPQTGLANVNKYILSSKSKGYFLVLVIETLL